MNTDVIRLLMGSSKVDDTSFLGGGSDNIATIHVATGGEDTSYHSLFGLINSTLGVSLETRVSNSFYGFSDNVVTVTLTANEPTASVSLTRDDPLIYAQPA